MGSVSDKQYSRQLAGDTRRQLTNFLTCQQAQNDWQSHQQASKHGSRQSPQHPEVHCPCCQISKVCLARVCDGISALPNVITTQYKLHSQYSVNKTTAYLA